MPDPGGFPVEPARYHVTYHGPHTDACKLKAQATPVGNLASDKSAKANQTSATPTTTTTTTTGSTPPSSTTTTTTNQPAGNSSTNSIGSLVRKLAAGVQGAVSGVQSGVAKAGIQTQSGASTVNHAQQLLSYLLSP